ncbi:MAG: YhcH/YjgK/YiaL family protein [Peptoniphilaceae bacterium]|nr:YhcH/YjgK/YiaL family protein [Peptoniphilaceae bacterium]MDD7383295.1 YhcH/YjgK/YiaL family protein [Peptoniphilaceae bacterium]MDY3738334.1 YhcH/YjgK/YiaL family protein [Peptoniphilaceae bacterium]
MIFTNINQNYEKQGLSEKIVKIIDFLKENKKSFLEKKPGRYEIDADDIFYNVIETKTEEKEKRVPESHKKYIDVHFIVKGSEKMGISQYDPKFKVKESNEKDDYILYEDVEKEGFILADENCISIFYPDDIHRVQVKVNDEEYEKKIVVKVKVDLLY